MCYKTKGHAIEIIHFIPTDKYVKHIPHHNQNYQVSINKVA